MNQRYPSAAMRKTWLLLGGDDVSVQAIDHAGETQKSACLSDLDLALQIKADGIDSEVAGRFHCPLGLPIGSSQSAEIAISIAAQLIQVHDQIKTDS